MKNMTKRKKSEGTVNVTKERLAGTPFSSMAEMDAASSRIRRETWNQLERARIKKELLDKPEFKFFLDTFRKGMICKYSESHDSLVKVSLGDDGEIAVDINDEMKSTENSSTFLSSLINATSDSLLSNYLKSMDVLTDSESKLKEADPETNKKRRSGR